MSVNQKFELWIEVLRALPEDAMAQVDFARDVFKDIIEGATGRNRGGCKLLGVLRVGKQLRVTFQGVGFENGLTSNELRSLVSIMTDRRPDVRMVHVLPLGVSGVEKRVGMTLGPMGKGGGV